MDKAQSWWLRCTSAAARRCTAAQGPRRMNFVWFAGREGHSRQFNLAHPATLALLGALVLAMLGTAFALGMQLGERTGTAINRNHALGAVSGALSSDKHELTELRSQAQDRI